MNPDMLRRAMEPANISAMMQMQQAMQQLQSSGMMPPGAMPGLNAGLGSPMGGGALGSGPGWPHPLPDSSVGLMPLAWHEMHLLEIVRRQPRSEGDLWLSEAETASAVHEDDVSSIHAPRIW